MAGWLAALVDMLAPPRCVACDEVLDGGGAPGPLCGACEAVVDRADEPPPAVDAALFLYGGPIADGILRAKHAGRSDVADGFARLMAREATPWLGAIDLVIPVPSHPSRVRARGYDVPARLAGPIARTLGATLAPDALARRRDTPPMRGLRPADRARNVRGAFRARPGPLDGARALLVDDVRTTGATLAEAARALLAAGARSVATYALAEVDGPG